LSVPLPISADVRPSFEYALQAVRTLFTHGSDDVARGLSRAPDRVGRSYNEFSAAT
jgi:hypothetical protein